MTVLQTKHKRQASNGINNIPAHGGKESSLNFYIKNPNNFIRSAIVMARSRQVKALTLSLAHHHINCSAVLLPVWLWHRRLYLFQLCTDLPLSAPRHLPITRFTETLMTLIMWRGHMARRSVCVWARMPAPQRLLRRPESRLHWRRGQALGHLPQNLTAVVMLSEEIWPWSQGGKRNGLFASASECHPRCPLLSGKSRRMGRAE